MAARPGGSGQPRRGLRFHLLNQFLHRVQFGCKRVGAQVWGDWTTGGRSALPTFRGSPSSSSSSSFFVLDPGRPESDRGRISTTSSRTNCFPLAFGSSFRETTSLPTFRGSPPPRRHSSFFVLDPGKTGRAIEDESRRRVRGRIASRWPWILISGNNTPPPFVARPPPRRRPRSSCSIRGRPEQQSLLDTGFPELSLAA